MDDISQKIKEGKLELRQQYGIQTIPKNIDLFGFSPGSPKQNYAVINGSNTWDCLALGYLLAADNLADLVISNGYNQDLLEPILIINHR